MHAPLEKLGRVGIVPVIEIDKGEDALLLSNTLLAGGLPCAEITLRTATAIDAIRNNNQPS